MLCFTEQFQLSIEINVFDLILCSCSVLFWIRKQKVCEVTWDEWSYSIYHCVTWPYFEFWIRYKKSLSCSVYFGIVMPYDFTHYILFFLNFYGFQPTSVLRRHATVLTMQLVFANISSKIVSALLLTKQSTSNCIITFAFINFIIIII